MLILEGSRTSTLLKLFRDAAQSESRFEGTMWPLSATKEMHTVTCSQGEEVYAITMRFVQGDSPKATPDTDQIIGGTVELGHGKSTVLFEQLSSGMTAQKISEMTLEEACRNANCATNGCLFRKEHERKTNLRKDAIEYFDKLDKRIHTGGKYSKHKSS